LAPAHVRFQEPDRVGSSVVAVVGKQVDYWSKSFESWMPASISGVDAERGLVELDVKPGVWIGATASYVRARTRPSQTQLDHMRRILKEKELLEQEASRIFDCYAKHVDVNKRDVVLVDESSAMNMGRKVDELLGVVGSGIWLKQHIVAAPDKALTLTSFIALLRTKMQALFHEYGRAVNLEHSAPQRFGNPEDKYVFEKELGAGSFGAVYQACEKGTQSRCAVKIVKKRPSTLASSELEQEIGHLCSLDHPHIIKLYEYFDFSGYVYLVMDFCTGGDLQSFVNKARELDRPMNEDFARLVFKQILKAIAHVHARGSMHLDLKCGNVMITPARGTLPPAGVQAECPILRGGKPHAMLIDLGLARIFHAGRLGAPCGTPTTMAPEVWRGELTPKADIFSIGVMLFEVLCNQLPFENVPRDEAGGRRYWGYTGEVPAPKVPWEKLADTSEDGEELCKEMMVYSRHERPTASDCLLASFFDADDVEPAEQTDLSMPVELKELTPKIVERLTIASTRTALQHSIALSIARRWPANQLPSIKRAFEALDSTCACTGRLYKEHVTNCLVVVGVEADTAQEIADSMDLDRNGMIDWTEFVSSCISLGDGSLDNDIRQLFDNADRDGDGLLSASDLGSMFIAEHLCEDSAICDAIDEIIDRSDPNARISCNDFMAYVKRKR